MQCKNTIAEKLLQVNAVKLNIQKPFVWASGWHSPIYCDNRKLLSYPTERNAVVDCFVELIKNNFASVELIAGVATAGIAWGCLIAARLNLPFIYVRATAKTHGLGNQIEGVAEENKNVLIIEDLISTGKSSGEVAEQLQQTLHVLGIVSIFTYSFPEAEKKMNELNIPSFSLTDYPTLLKIAIEKNIIGKDDEENLLKWKNDPANWKAKN